MVVSQMTELDYESIENAVMETARGRWFLSEYKKRHASTASPDTPALLEAIGRLEKVIASIGPDFARSPEPTTSAEQPKTPAFTPAVVATPEDFSKPPKAENAGVASAEHPQLSEENLQFFSNDEDLFADDVNALLPDPVEVARQTDGQEQVSDQPSPETETADAPQEPAPASERFKIFKASEKNGTDAPQDQMQQQPETSSVPDVDLQPTNDEQERIVVIRKSADSDIDIPLPDDFQDALSPQKDTPAVS